MAENVDVLKLFEGLSAEQAKALRESVFPMLKTARAKITQQEQTKMLNNNDNQDNDLAEVARAAVEEAVAELRRQQQGQQAAPGALTPEENAEVAAVTQGIVAKRRAAALQPAIDEYVRQMTDPAVRGKRWLLSEIKERARRNGVPVDEVDFTGKGHHG
jgi:hypothetical protein